MLSKFLENLNICLTKGEPPTNLVSDLDDYMLQAFILTYNKIPFICHPSQFTKNKTHDNNDFKRRLQELNIININLINIDFNDLDNIDLIKSYDNICKKFPETVRIPITVNYDILFNNTFILTSMGRILLKSSEIPEGLIDCFALKEVPKEPNVYLVTKGTYGFEKNEFKLNTKPIDGNYNDDFPYDKIQNIIKKEGESGLILLSSVPGAGKTYFIRHLVETNPETQFLYLDSSIFNYINDSSFINFLLRNKDSVVILEDCESILKSRESDYNNLLSTLLNISDGLLGDSLNLKFICTFNTNLNNIDKALLRKGRLKLKYELKELTKEKVEKIFEKLGIDKSLAKPMTLADAYNFEDEVGVKQKKKIGF